jgi:hypothetical protein
MNEELLFDVLNRIDQNLSELREQLISKSESTSNVELLKCGDLVSITGSIEGAQSALDLLSQVLPAPGETLFLGSEKHSDPKKLDLYDRELPADLLASLRSIRALTPADLCLSVLRSNSTPGWFLVETRRSEVVSDPWLHRKETEEMGEAMRGFVQGLRLAQSIRERGES